jgi:hypothetical protein
MLRIYPAAYRDRFGEQMLLAFEDLYRDEIENRGRPVAVFWLALARDLVISAARQHVLALREQQMSVVFRQSMHLYFASLRQPDAFLPVAMSLAGLGLVVGHYMMYGITHETDEGAAAHIFQMLMLFQLPIIAFFALRSFFRSPLITQLVLALQFVAGDAAMASVYFLT